MTTLGNRLRISERVRRYLPSWVHWKGCDDIFYHGCRLPLRPIFLGTHRFDAAKAGNQQVRGVEENDRPFGKRVVFYGRSSSGI